MSLAILGIQNDQAIIVSDGAVTAAYPDGRHLRASDCCPKYRVVRHGWAVAACGGSHGIESVLYPGVTSYLDSFPDASFDDLVQHLAAVVPAAQRAEEEECTRLGVPVTRDGSFITVGLIGFDAAAGAARLIRFQPRDAYVPTAVRGPGYMVMGGAADPSVPRNPMWAHQVLQRRIADASRTTPFSDMTSVLVATVTEIGRAHPLIGGNVYSWMATADPARRVTRDTASPRAVADRAPAGSYSGTWDTLALSINGGGYGAPGGSPIVVTRTGSDQVYTFKATKDGVDHVIPVTIPAIVVTPGSGYFTSVSQALHSDITNEINLNWGWSGSAAYYDIILRENGGAWGLVGSTATSVFTYRYTTAFDLDATIATPRVTVEFYARAMTPSGPVITESQISSNTYGHA